MVVSIPRVAEGKEAHAILTIEVTRHTLLPPDETDLYVVPDAKSLPPDFKQYLGPSPLIESSHAADQGHRQATRRGPDQGLAPRPRDLRLGPQDDPVQEERAVDRLRGGHRQGQRRLQPVDFDVHRHLPGQRHSRPHGPDSRALLSGILSSATTKGQGHWFPAEVSGTEDFGGIFTHTPILQKGDAFRISVPDTEPPTADEDRDLPPPALESDQSEPEARRRPADIEIGLRTGGR